MLFQIIRQSSKPYAKFHFMLLFHDGVSFAPLMAPELEDHTALSVSDCFNEFTVNTPCLEALSIRSLSAHHGPGDATCFA
jgi:hypothetical protein